MKLTPAVDRRPIDQSPFRRRHPDDYNELYARTPPWEIGRPQPALLDVAEAGGIRGHVLDVGCGTGEHALMAASLGLRAMGIDSAAGAIAIAEHKARQRHLSARFLIWDALNLGGLDQTFDTVIDSGLFHVLDDQQREVYVEGLRDIVTPGGRIFILCFSDQQPGDIGPRRVSPREIRESFANGWQIDAIESATIDTTRSAIPVMAWRTEITKTHDLG